AQAHRLSFRPHTRRRARRSRPRHLYRPGGPGLYRAPAGAWRLRPGDLPHSQGVRADLQPRRRHGHGHARGPDGFEVGYEYFAINGRMLGHGEPIRVKTGQRVLFHVLNASATEIRSLALPGHVFRVVALDGNPVPTPADVPVLWLGTAERISAIVEMKHPGVWILGDLANDDRKHGMG